MSHRPREDEPSVIDLDSRRPGRSAGRRPNNAKGRIIRGLHVIQDVGDPDEIKRCLVRGKIEAALGKVLVDGQLPDEVEE